MSQPLISVIVPVYKVEEYLERCVSSIRNQTYTNLEIILVDDGSPDRSGEMCDAFAQQDSRIRVIHKENGGLSSARNAGMRVAKGEYIGFIDSDDWIDERMYETLYTLILKYEAQIAVCGLQCDHTNGNVSWFNPKYPDSKETEVFTTQDALRELTYAEKITNSACDKLFFREILEGLPLKEGIIFEDTQIMHRWMERADRIVYTPQPYYHYIMTDGSITRSGIKPSRLAIADVLWERVEYYQHKHPQLTCYAILSYVNVTRDMVAISAGSPECADLRKELIRKVRSIKPKSFFSLIGIKSKIMHCLFMMNVDLFMCARAASSWLRRKK